MKTRTGLVFNCTKVTQKKKINVHIRLDDECNNKHCEFAITCDGYEKRGGHWIESFGGCCHDEILKWFPEFKDFVALHLCDVHGAPLYALENGLFLLKEKGAQACADYLRIPVALAEQLKNIDKNYVGYILQESGVFDAWQKEADAAIAHLEQLTGEKFENPYKDDEERRNAAPLTKEELNEIVDRIKAGYYTPEAIQKRADEEKALKQAQERARIEQRYDSEISKNAEEKQIMLYIFDRLGTTDNIIFYNHSRTITFNWKVSYSCNDYCKHWSRQEFDDFVNFVGSAEDDGELPEDIKFEFKEYKHDNA